MRDLPPDPIAPALPSGPQHLPLATTSAPTIPEWLARAASAWPDRPALAGVDDEAFLSHRELHALVMEQAERLRSWGIGRGDIVLHALPDGPMAIAALLTIASVATVLPVAAQEQPEEYARIIDQVPVRAILMDERPHAPLTRLAEERGLILLRASPRRDAPGAFVLSVARAGSPHPEESPSPDDDALYTLTSGTTAIPKIVAISHRSLWHQLEGSRRWFELSERDRSLCLMPIAHLHSIIRCSLPVLASGGAVIGTPGFDARSVVGWLDHFRPTFISAAPAVHRLLIQTCAAAGWQPGRPSPRLFAASSDRLDSATRGSLERLFGARVVQLYGLTETSPLIAATPLDGWAMPDGSTGQVNPVWEVACIDADGDPVARGERGEIAVRGGFVNPIVGGESAGVQRFDRSGRFLTGDLGRVDDEGFLFVEGRVDEMINRGGQKVNPAVVEAAIASHPAVRAVAAFATPDTILGSRVAAAVELHPGSTTSESDLLDHAGLSLRSYMVPERLFLTEAIPRNHLGKVSRRDLPAHFSPVAAASDPAGAANAVGVTGAPAAPPDDVLEAVISVYRRVLRREDIDPDTSFFDLGGDSLHSLYAMLELEERLGQSLPPATFARYSTAFSLAAYVAEHRGRVSPERLTQVQAGDGEPQLVSIHGLDGQYSHLAVSLARLGLAPGLPIFALGSASQEDLASEPSTLEELADEYARLVRENVPGPRRVLAGYSLGAQLARATGNSLAAAGAAPDLLVLIDDEAELDRRSFGAAGTRLQDPTVGTFYQHLVSAYPAAPYPGRVLFIRNEEDEAEHRSDPTGGWGEIALGGVELAVVAGNHHALVEQAHLPELARVLVDGVTRVVASPTAAPGSLDAQRVLRLEARRACVRGDLAGEITSYREVIALDREQPAWVYENLGSALLDAGDVSAASAAFDQALGRDPWPLSIALRSVERWLTHGLGAYVERALTGSSRLRVDHPSVLHQRGQLAMAAGLLDEAEALFRRGLAMAPVHFKIHIGLSEVLRRQGRFAEAAEVLAETNEQTPGQGWLIVLEAETLLEAGLAASAWEVLERARPLIDDAYRGPLVRSMVLEAVGSDARPSDPARRAA